MRTASVYSVECICGRLIESETNSLVCPGCRRLVVIEWPAAEEQPRPHPDSARLGCGLVSEPIENRRNRFGHPELIPEC